MKKEISKKQFINAYRSAGLWFVGLYMEAFLIRIDELRDNIQRTKLIEEIYDNGENAFDRDIGGTRTRVNSLKRIIEAGRVNEALEEVIKSNRVTRENPEAVKRAKDLLEIIESGELNISE
jgi:hypothetical protein